MHSEAQISKLISECGFLHLKADPLLVFCSTLTTFHAEIGQIKGGFGVFSVFVPHSEQLECYQEHVMESKALILNSLKPTKTTKMSDRTLLCSDFLFSFQFLLILIVETLL